MVVVEEEIVTGDVVEELSVLVDTATVVDVPVLTVVDEEPPPPHAAKKTRPATTTDAHDDANHEASHRGLPS